MILLVIGLFILDIFVYSVLDFWLLFSLLIFYINYLFYFSKPRIFILSTIIIGLVLQDFLVVGRVGLCLIYVLPMLFFAGKMRILFKKDSIIPNIFIYIFFIVIHFFLIKMWILLQGLSIRSTIMVVLVNLIIMITSLKIRQILGMQGNRSI